MRFFFLFCLKMCEREKLEALFLKLYENLNDSYPNVLYKTPEWSFSRSGFEDDGRKVASWLHSHVKSMYSSIMFVVLQRSRWRPSPSCSGSLLVYSCERVETIRKRSVWTRFFFENEKSCVFKTKR